MDVLARLRASLVVWPPAAAAAAATAAVDAKPAFAAAAPDLYGPVWVSITLVFVIGVTSNFASYLSSARVVPGATTAWVYDFSLVTTAALVIAAYVVGAPVLVWALLRYLGAPPRPVTSIVSIYGYALVAFIPAAFLCMTPSPAANWVFISLACAVSAVTLARNLVPGGLAETGPMRTVLAVVIGVHVALGILLRMYFFSFVSETGGAATVA